MPAILVNPRVRHLGGAAGAAAPPPVRAAPAGKRKKDLGQRKLRRAENGESGRGRREPGRGDVRCLRLLCSASVLEHGQAAAQALPATRLSARAEEGGPA
jgi:hypothetical protein